MFSIIKQVFIVLLIFSESLALNQTKYLFLSDEPCMVRPNLIDLNPVDIKYYPFVISLDKCSGNCNVFSPKICVPKETKDINVKAFNMLTKKKMRLKQRQNIFHMIVNANSIVQLAVQIKNGRIKHANVNVKIIISANKITVGILVHVLWK